MIDPFAFILIALAVYRICRFFIEDRLFDEARERIWRRLPPETTRTGYFFTCYWCMSIWVAPVMILCYMILPLPTLIVAAILAVSTVVGWIDSFINR